MSNLFQRTTVEGKVPSNLSSIPQTEEPDFEVVAPPLSPGSDASGLSSFLQPLSQRIVIHVNQDKSFVYIPLFRD